MHRGRCVAPERHGLRHGRKHAAGRGWCSHGLHGQASSVHADRHAVACDGLEHQQDPYITSLCISIHAVFCTLRQHKLREGKLFVVSRSYGQVHDVLLGALTHMRRRKGMVHPVHFHAGHHRASACLEACLQAKLPRHCREEVWDHGGASLAWSCASIM